MRRFQNNVVFGDEDILNGRTIYTSTAIAKSHCWILKIKSDIFKTEMKETVRKIKEAKAVFIYYSLPYKCKGFGYMKFKDFFMKNFIQEKVKIHTKIIKEGTESDRLIIIKHGTFALIK